MSLEGRAIGVVFGGANAEHDVSLRSARSVVEALASLGARPRLLGIDRAGVWHRVDSVDDLATRVSREGDIAAVAGPRDDQLAGLDAVFPVIHGRGGEDGTVQGALELARVSYVGCGVLSSALAMDKRMAARVLLADGLPVVDTRSVTSLAELGDVARGMSLPLFVKPNRAGSSVGATRVDELDQLAPAVRTALREDTTALLQPLIVGDEVSIGVLQDARGGIHASGPSALRLSPDERFFSYDGKYGGGETRLEIPAMLPDALVATLQAMAVAAFEALDCSGLARVDFFVESDGTAQSNGTAQSHGTVLINEVNTMPGFGADSHYPRLWRAAGVGYDQLVSGLVQRALA